MEQNESVEASKAESTGTSTSNDDLKNLKAEMTRKMGNLESTNAQLLAQLQKMQSSLTPSTPQKSENKKISVFDDEEAYAARIKEETAAEMRKELAQQQAMQQKQASTIANLVNDFPELNDTSHELTKKAIEIFNSYADDEKNSPVAYKAAVKEAALDLGIKPKSKRSQEEQDGFTIGGSAPRKSQKSEALNPNTLELARILGLNVDDPKVKERLKSHSKRNFSKWS